MSAELREPTTPAEWIQIVTMAAAFVKFDAAKQYGLITGGPVVNVDRCRELLERGARDGWLPRDREVDEFLRVLGRGDAG